MEATIDLYNALLKHFLSLDGFNLVSTSPRQGSEVFSLGGATFAVSASLHRCCWRGWWWGKPLKSARANIVKFPAASLGSCLQKVNNPREKSAKRLVGHYSTSKLSFLSGGVNVPGGAHASGNTFWGYTWQTCARSSRCLPTTWCWLHHTGSDVSVGNRVAEGFVRWGMRSRAAVIRETFLTAEISLKEVKRNAVGFLLLTSHTRIKRNILNQFII